MTAKDFILYIILPFVILAHPFLWFVCTGEKEILSGESGIIELVTVALLIVSIFFCVKSFIILPQELPQKLRIWLCFLILGAIYFAGEELSWGQHMFGWETSESWKEINNQKETNLHNTHALFDQVPRFVVTFCIFVGGIILPIVRHVRKTELNRESIYYWVLPTAHCMFAGVVAVLSRPVFSAFDITFFSIGEFKECLIATFICIYCMSLQLRLSERRSAAAEA